DWAIGPFTKHPANPVLAPSPDGWDVGARGGVHNGAILRRNGKFHYVYRGWMPHPPTVYDEWLCGYFDWVCDIGLAVSDDGVHFQKDRDHSPFFRTGDDKRRGASQRALELLRQRPRGHGRLACLRRGLSAVGRDLMHWDKVGLVFPGATTMHRNACVLQNPRNQAVRVNGQFVMFLNFDMMAYSDDLIHWHSQPIPPAHHWPGGEGCFALCDYRAADPDAVLLFTGGHHSGHFYAIGEVLFSKRTLPQPLEWLPRPVLAADPSIPCEDGRDASPPHKSVSYFRDTVFFTGLTRHADQWWAYYGGSERYTCLAQAPVKS
ncbi:MAG: hypothetical protein NT031_01240, partial [Planctomycetota bacterium]|nr:hypothetical protein [Planctomycetota bacterium]